MAAKICTYDIVCMFPLGEMRTSKVWNMHKSQQIQNAMKENRNFIDPIID